MATTLYPYARATTVQARDIVRNIIRSSGTPLSTHDIFKHAVKQQPSGSTSAVVKKAAITDSSTVPYPDHPIRSMTYLKQIVLPELLERKEVEKVHVQRTLTTEEIEHRLAGMTKAAKLAHAHDPATTIDSWLWQARTRPVPVPVVKTVEPAFGTEVGVDEDWSHLNRRRRRARELKVGRDVKWMRKLQRAKEIPVAEAESL